MSYKNEEVKKKVLDVLFKNHNRNLFSSQVRELIAQQVADDLILDNSTKDRSLTENGIVFDHKKTGTPINTPVDDETKEVKKEISKPVVKNEKSTKKPRPKRTGRKKTSPKREVRRTVNVEESSGLKNLKNK